MEKEEWQNEYSILAKALAEFNLNYPNYKNGKSAKTKKDAERGMNYPINLVKMRIEINLDLKRLLFDGYDSSGYGAVWEEFFNYSFFGNDLEEFLKKINTKINNL